jgi:peptidoglycan/xylan/chitin deacetylase (PgdA/CDA1 family)
MTMSVASIYLLAAAMAAAPPPMQWPHGAKAAVSLAYDDALDSQLDHAIPALNKYGLKGSFYLQLSSPVVGKRLAQWRAAAADGHELGNHTLFHQCARNGPGREWVQQHRNLDTTTAQQMKDQVVVANVMLAAIDGRSERTFTAPCFDQLAAGENYLPLVHSEFVAMKAGVASAVPASIAALDPYRVGALAPVGLSGKNLIAIVKEAAAKGTMANLTFHGIGGDHLVTSKEAHEELLAYLAANKGIYWTDTFLNIMKHVRANVIPGWTLDWSDEFDGTTLNSSKWVAETGGHGWGNKELQHYTGRPENVRLAGGMLVIEARKEKFEKSDYTSARIKTAGRFERTYGRFEARMKLPKGQGIWPAFWMLGGNIATAVWPRSGEIDVMEHIGKEPGLVYGTLHGPGYSGEYGFGKSSPLADGAYSDDFHIYAVEWERGEIRWYRDGFLYHTARPELVKGDWVFDHPFFVLLNLAVGGYWPGNPDATTVLPQQLLVDYVRVYRRTTK